ncbi:MAG TPA: DinB family protein [Tepidisphaeraceae bacterium]|nr:DinB family protein [Tepidisphaeraceae bacterium]
MNQSELSAELLKGNLEMLKGTLADFSDADMLARPCPGANHPAWQVGHLIGSEVSMLNALKPGSAPELPAGFLDRFKKETAGNDDASFFPKKAELLDALSKVRAATITLAQGLTPADMDQPAPEKMRSWAPTVAHLLAMIPAHTMMHVGQFQVCRRKLGKPVLF